jgi:hypothetical protein
MPPTDPRRHNYCPKLIALWQQGKIPEGRLTDVEVAHDDWCGIHAGGYCNCDPDVRLRSGPDRN